MLATGLLLCWCNYGLVADEVVLLLMFHSVASFSLVLSMALTGRFRRKTGLSTSFAVWLLPWTVFPLILGMFILLIGLHFFQGDSIMDGLLDFLSIGAIGGIVLYLLNLPFMLLAFRSPFYRRRFCAVFGLQCVEQRALNDIEIEPQE